MAHRDAPGPAEGPTVKLTAQIAGEGRPWLGRIVWEDGEIDPRTRMANAVA